MTGPATARPELHSLPDRPSLRQSALADLRGGIVSGRLRPGVLYSAPQLAEQLGVSATPVREAMLELAREGLVEAVRNKGFRIREIDDAELDEITQLRELIEVPAVGLVATGDRRAEAEQLRDLAEQIVVTAGEGDLTGYVESDRDFHLGLLELAGNRLLTRTVGELRARSRLYGLETLVGTAALLDSAREHHELLDLVLAGDRTGAEDLMRRHLRHVRGSWATGRQHD
ncbi:FCD domain-containing protein [Nakamurella sp. YIM 132087]|uniref:FCD domain-containing protein n=1 Tax=Nakamurella alba TaxID=2665158 RepID=A0A7K1FQ97_9ACTN|nr:GntR family transcriptional regulator [Nakamurella alba]MTD15529.1 FCD domain-containing protein [Nakamurella alba]